MNIPFFRGFSHVGDAMHAKRLNWNGKKCTKFTSNVTQREYEIKDFISCRTEGVVYDLQCSCSLQYIGRTKRPMWKRIREHIQNIKKTVSPNITSHDILPYVMKKTLQISSSGP